MIITLTGNLLAERTFEFPSWEAGKTQRAARESFQVGGKGVNVSRMLARLGTRTVALCFAGGPTGDECLRWLNEHVRGVDWRAFRSGTATRTGLVVRATGERLAVRSTGAEGAIFTETTFLGPDVAPDAAALAACAAWLDAAPAEHALAFCGSFPGWDTPAAAPLRDAIERRIERGIAHGITSGIARGGNDANTASAASAGNVYVDTYGAPLAWFVERPAALVKINRAEFDRLARETNHRETNAPAASAASDLAADPNLQSNRRRRGVACDARSGRRASQATPLQANLEASWNENSMPARLDAARRRWPSVRAWVVTDGPRPIWHAAGGAAASDAAGVAAGAVANAAAASAPASLQPPAIREVSATGAGDVLFACIMHGLIERHLTLAEAVAEAIPFATAKAAGSGLPEQHSRTKFS